jgi:anthranilate phosphoribosyltransferase
VIRDFIKKVGTGPHGVRDLSRAEALESAGLILSGSATPAQTGALLLGLRLKGETGEEFSGFLDALKTRLPADLQISDAALRPDLDIGDPYDGRSRTTSLLVPSALHGAKFGLRTVLHGLSHVPVKKGPGVLEGWRAHGKYLSPPSDAIKHLERFGALCLSQSDFLPELARLLPLRQELGLRTIFNTVEKAVNPMGARVQLIGIFHEPVMEKLQTACLAPRTLGKGTPDTLLPRRTVFVQGVEGGVDLHPHRPTTCFITDPDHGMILSPVTIPAHPEGKPFPSPKDPATDLLTLSGILEIPGHPLRSHLDRQTAFFLFAAGLTRSFSEALNKVSDPTGAHGHLPNLRSGPPHA